MAKNIRSARINVKFLIILVVIAAVLLGGAAVGYKVRKRIIADRALAAGEAAYAEQNWSEACKQYKQYISRYPDENPEILARYAQANLAVRPTEFENIGAAIGAYRRYIRVVPDDLQASHELMDLYLQIGDFSEAAYISRQHLKLAPDDVEARLVLSRALVGLGKGAEARDEWLKPLIEAHPDQVDAYLLLSELAGQDRDQGAEAALDWLNQAIAANPESAKALIRRAAYHHERIRALFGNPNPDREAIEHLNEQVRADLEAVDALQVKDPWVLRRAFDLWLTRNEQAKAEDQLRALESLDDQTLAEFDVERDLANLFIFTAAGELARQRGDGEAGVALADRACAELPERQKLNFLELAINLYLAGDRLDKARASLDELRKGVGPRLPNDPALAEKLSVLDAAITVNDQKANPFEAIKRLREILVTSPENEKAWKLLGEAYIRTGQVLRGLAALEEHVKLNRYDRESLLTLARNYLRFDHFKAAGYALRLLELNSGDLEAHTIRIAAAMRAVRAGTEGVDKDRLSQELLALGEAYPEALDVHVLQAALAAEAGDGEEGLAELSRAIDACEDHADKASASLQLAGLAQQQGMTEKAVAAARSAVELQPDSANPRLQLAQLLEAEGRSDEAGKVYEQATTELEGKERYQAHLARSRFLLAQESPEQGIEILRQVAEENPYDTQVRLIMLGLPQIRQNPGQAQKLIDELRTIEGDNGLLWPVEQARLWLAAGSPSPQRGQEIISLLTPVIEDGSAGPDPVLMLGSLYRTLGDISKEEDIYRRSIEQRPHIQVLSRLLALLENQARFDEASALLDRFPAANSTALSGHRMMVSLGQGDTQTAINELERRLEADPENAATKATLARLIYSQSKDADSALALLDEAESLSPGMPELLAARVAILRDQGHRDEALELLDREVESRNDFSTYRLRASFHAAEGNTELAEKDYRHLTTFEEHAVRGYEALAMFYVRLEQLDQAIAVAREGLELDREDLALQRLVAASLMHSPDAAERARGQEMVDQLHVRVPNDTSLLLLRAMHLLQNGDLSDRAEPEALLERIVSLNPRMPRAHLFLIDLAREKRDRALVGQRVSRGLAANPGDPDLLFARAAFEADYNNDFAAARRTAEEIIAGHPDHLVALKFLANLAFQAGDMEAAETYTQRALAVDPNDETAILASASILSNKGRIDEAVKVVNDYRQTEAGGQSLAAVLVLVDLYMQADRLDDAGRTLDEAAELAVDSPHVLQARLMWLAAQKRYDEMVNLVSNPSTGIPNIADLQEFAVGMLLGEQQLEKALQLCHVILKAEPARVSTLVTLGQLSYTIQDLPAAEDAYKTVLQHTPDQQQALNDLAWIVGVELGRPDEGIQYADQGVNRYPNDYHLRDTRAAILIRLGRLEEAVTDLGFSLQLTSEEPSRRRTHISSRLHRAEAYVKLDRLEDAVGDLEICLALSADNPNLLPERINALRLLAETEVKLKRPADARKHYEEILRIHDENPQRGDLSESERERILQALDALSNAQVSSLP